LLWSLLTRGRRSTYDLLLGLTAAADVVMTPKTTPMSGRGATVRPSVGTTAVISAVGPFVERGRATNSNLGSFATDLQSDNRDAVTSANTL
jgi:hypothetical protein